MFAARHCGTIENKFWGTFTPLDADADGFYDSDLNCAWEIHSFNPARITSFYLTEFDIPASDGCALDYLRVKKSSLDSLVCYWNFLTKFVPGPVKRLR